MRDETRKPELPQLVCMEIKRFGARLKYKYVIFRNDRLEY